MAARQSFVYAASRGAILGSYALVLWGTALVVPPLGREGHALMSAGCVLAVALVLDPVRRALQSRVYRRLYSKELDYRLAVRELSHSLTALLDVEQIVGEVKRVLTGAMDLEAIALCVFHAEGDEGRLWRYRGDVLQLDVADDRLWRAASFLCTHGGAWDPRGLARGSADAARHEEIRDALEPLGARAIVPLTFRGAPVGLLLLGDKRAGEPLSALDIDLLRTLASQAAIAIQNARSYQALEAVTRRLDESVREKTARLGESHRQLSRAYDELKGAQVQLVQSEKMASLGQLVAAVAHELNNPASFVHGALSSLEEYLNRLVAVLAAYDALPIPAPAAESIAQARQQARLDYLLRETPELLRISTEGTERMKRLVDDLRLFARADQGERRSIDVVDGVDDALRRLDGRLRRAGVTLATDYRDRPRIEANEGQLGQVWTNVLTNAIEAVEGSAAPAIDVSVHSLAGGAADTIEVAIRDNGAGMPPEIANRIFEPFFTTKPSGRGTGLGLSIAYGAAKSHGGTIEVDSVAGQGTIVRVRLPGQPTSLDAGDEPAANESSIPSHFDDAATPVKPI
jgi:signal transduction histidine kinase